MIVKEPITSRILLELMCHVKLGKNATLEITVDDVKHEFTLLPTINWVASSTSVDAHKILLILESPLGLSKIFKFKIAAKHNDVLVCGYKTSRNQFQISSQPIWNILSWRPYDISGHVGDNAEFQGNGSLQVMAEQTVEFDGKLI
jgi:hypothetical protein